MSFHSTASKVESSGVEKKKTQLLCMQEHEAQSAPAYDWVDLYKSTPSFIVPRYLVLISSSARCPMCLQVTESLQFAILNAKLPKNS